MTDEPKHESLVDKLLHHHPETEVETAPEAVPAADKTSLEDLLKRWQDESARIQGEVVSSDNPRAVVDAKLAVLGTCIRDLQAYVDANK